MVLQATPEAALFDRASKYRNRPLIFPGKLHSWKLCVNAGKQREETGHEEYQVTKFTPLEERTPLKNFVLV